jgi:uncharacterized membrane protein
MRKTSFLLFQNNPTLHKELKQKKMDSIRKLLRLDSEHPPYRIIAFGICALLVVLGIILIAIGSHGAGISVILIALLGLSVVILKRQLQRMFNPSPAQDM